jgi:hypothetical protein
LDFGSSRSGDIPAKYTFLSLIAYFLFSKDQRSFSLGDLKEIERSYFAEYDIALPVETIVGDMTANDLLSKVGDRYRFTFPSYYQFFLARHLARRAKDKATQAETYNVLRDMAGHLYYEIYANVIIYYLYFSQDTELIEHIVSDAQKIYSNYPVCGLEQEVEFVNKLYIEAPKPIHLAIDDIRAVRTSRAGGEFEEDEQPDPDCEPNERDRDVSYSEDLDDVVKISLSFKTLQVLGQVLRDFPTVLRAELKTRVADECYKLGLRVLSLICVVSENNLEELRRYVSSLIKEQRKIESSSVLAKTTDEFLLRMVGCCAYGIIKRISYAVGSDQLSRTYQNVIDRDVENKLSMRLVDLSIKLDHFSFPVDEIVKTAERVKKNYFCFQLLRDLVMNFMVNNNMVTADNHREIKRALQIDIGAGQPQGFRRLTSSE